MAKTSGNGTKKEIDVNINNPVNLDEQMKSIEVQISELRGVYNYLIQLKKGGYEVIPPEKIIEESVIN
jgi:ABC-type oligopeptide transport system substrate-binding subunit